MDDRRLTQSDVARLVGVSQPTVQRWLAGKMPRGNDLIRLQNELGLAESTPGTLRNNAVEKDVELWRRRAKNAEAELHQLKQGMRDLLARPSSKIEDAGEKLLARGKEVVKGH